MLIYSFGIAVLAYIILCYGILFKGAAQPLSATLLWLLLDGLAAWTAFSSGGNWLLAAGYATGCVLAAAASIYRKKTYFAKSDVPVAVLVAICLVVWLGIGDVAGLIASSLAMLIANVPVMIHYAKRPRDGQLSVWLLFAAANLIGFFGREGNALADWFFPVCAAAGSIVTIWLLVVGRLRAKWR